MLRPRRGNDPVLWALELEEARVHYLEICGHFLPEGIAYALKWERLRSGVLVRGCGNGRDLLFWNFPWALISQCY